MQALKSYSQYLLCLCLLGQLVAMYLLLGPRVCLVASVMGVLWFGISLVLLTRPPGIPEFVTDEVGSDEQHVVRNDVIPTLLLIDRIRLALGVACGASLVIWLTVVLLAA